MSRISAPPLPLLRRPGEHAPHPGAVVPIVLDDALRDTLDP
jgi:hypothetical protein